ncbi:PLP-dependent transferase [Tilletiaria anomala UBC 951]|uniref:PLP-dependent transferase n=1 Tax=Tilletiaria anomala (strain ATCC 24038 / CBS 436.72 / UBC 951) TaxID=1037660 RepID=A0A066VP25_TILAU|nr:PLP-dependent transferase [Tilletiaria anomala UBC 951]KDN43216.1 PLP-dependent transferase [Tilletiaria anomala UBC 951]
MGDALATAGRAPDDCRDATDESTLDGLIASLRIAELPSLYGNSSSSASPLGEPASYQQIQEHQQQLYLDSAGMPPSPISATRLFEADMAHNFFANPHSHSPAAVRTVEMIEVTRDMILQELFCLPKSSMRKYGGKGKAKEDPRAIDGCGWELVFTSGATASLKLVAESFDFGPSNTADDERGQLLHLLESHTSVVGLRGIAKERGVRSAACDEDEMPSLVASLDSERSLAVAPLQCNATGRRFHVLLEKLGGHRTKVLVDAASYLSSSTRLPLPAPSDEAAYERAPDFIAFSFYKIFGMPTGLGGLLVKRTSALSLSCKPYYGGGTLSLLLPRSGRGVPRAGLADRMEDGTINFHGVLALKHALQAHETMLGNWAARQRHICHLTRELYAGLSRLRHYNGQRLVHLLSRSDASRAFLQQAHCSMHAADQGPIAAFLLLLPNGQRVATSEISRIASLRNVHLRVGRHCNAGVALTHTLAADVAAIADQETGNRERMCDEQGLWDIWQRGTGCDNAEGVDDEASSVRVSLSVWNTLADVDALVSFLKTYFLIEAPPMQTLCDTDATTTTRWPSRSSAIGERELKCITLYPIKSCAGQEVQAGQSWPLTPHGLLHDREWCIVDAGTGKALSQKRVPKMATIRARVDRERELLHVTLPYVDGADGDGDATELTIDMKDSGAEDEEGEEVRVCADVVRPRLYTNSHVVHAFSSFLQRDCTLARLPPQSASRHGHFDVSLIEAGSSLAHPSAHGLDGPVPRHVPILLSNESPFLLINEESVRQVMGWMAQDGFDVQGTALQIARRFRANFVVGIRAIASAGADAPLPEYLPLPSASCGEGSEDTSEDSHTVSSPATSPPVSRPSSQAGHDGTSKAGCFQFFAEDSMKRVEIGEHAFASLGACRRCEMVAVDQVTGERRPETLLSLARRRRSEQGRVEFGMHLCWLPVVHDIAARVPSVHIGMAANFK